MATFYFELRAKPNKRGEHTINLVVNTGNGQHPSRKATGYKIAEKYWNASGAGTGEVIRNNHPNAMEWNEALKEKLNEARKVFGIMDREQGQVTAKNIAKALKMGDGFYNVAMLYESKFRKANKIGTADRYLSQANIIERYYPGIKIGEMNNSWAEKYKEKLEAKGYKKNTIVGKLKFVNSVINKAVKEGMFAYNPMQTFRKGSFKASENGKRLTAKEIGKFWQYIPNAEWDRRAKLTALFSYYASGARFKDVLLMPKKALYTEDGKLRMRWQPSKTKHTTGIWVDIPVNERLAAIIKQAKNDSSTIFGIIDPSLPPQALDKAINSAEQEINKKLKIIMLNCGIAKAIAFNDMRRTFLKHFQDSTGDIYLAKQAVRHEKVSTTEGYVGVDQTALDRALNKLYAVI